MLALVHLTFTCPTFHGLGESFTFLKSKQPCQQLNKLSQAASALQWVRMGKLPLQRHQPSTQNKTARRFVSAAQTAALQ